MSSKHGDGVAQHLGDLQAPGGDRRGEYARPNYGWSPESSEKAQGPHAPQTGNASVLRM